MSPMRPPAPLAGATTAAPAPSAKIAEVPRSVRSMKRLSTSDADHEHVVGPAALDLGGGEGERG